MMTRNLTTTMKSICCLTLIVAMSVIYGQMQASFGVDWAVNLSRLRVHDAQEESWFSNGDEPYFVMISFRSRFDVPDSTSVWHNDYNDDEWFEGADDGDERNIHFSMGYSLFANVRRGEIIGALVVAMESDSSPWGDIGDMVEHLEDEISDEVERLIEDGELDLLNPVPDIQEAFEHIVESMTPDFWEGVELALNAASDPDDMIGYHLFLFVRNSDVPDDIPLDDNATCGRLIEREFLIGDNPIVFRGDHATYRVTARIQRSLPLTAPQNPKVANQTDDTDGKAATSWGKIKND